MNSYCTYITLQLPIAHVLIHLTEACAVRKHTGFNYPYVLTIRTGKDRAHLFL